MAQSGGDKSASRGTVNVEGLRPGTREGEQGGRRWGEAMVWASGSAGSILSRG